MIFNGQSIRCVDSRACLLTTLASCSKKMTCYYIKFKTCVPGLSATKAKRKARANAGWLQLTHYLLLARRQDGKSDETLNTRITLRIKNDANFVA
jgi:hypothetical protein